MKSVHISPRRPPVKGGSTFLSGALISFTVESNTVVPRRFFFVRPVRVKAESLNCISHGNTAVKEKERR